MEPTTEERLTWRLDPSTSHSDWTIEIVTSDDDHPMENAIIYHVHKCLLLAVGPRKSEYFCRLFQTNSFAESQSNKSRIQLQKQAADAFPDVLDFVYGGNDDRLNVSSTNATALHFLGEYFEMPRLRWEASQFWQSDLTLKNCSVLRQPCLRTKRL